MTYEVLRAFDASGEHLVPGQVVDVTAWRPRNVEGLVNSRYLRPAAIPTPDGFEVQFARRGAGHTGKKAVSSGKE